VLLAALFHPAGAAGMVDARPLGQVVDARTVGQVVDARGDERAQSDVRGAISAVEQYYTDIGHYPGFSIAADNSRGSKSRVRIGKSSAVIFLSGGTRLYYVPGSRHRVISYRICATNGGGGGKWYLYDSADGGSIETVRRPLNPAACR
jgi:hypothetical protein